MAQHPAPASPDSSVRTWPDERSYSQTNRYPELADPGRRQRWVLSRAQLREAGWNRHRVDHEIRAGRWTPVSPTVVALQNGPLDRAQSMWLGTLHAGSPGALTHATVLEVAGLRWTHDPVIHVLTQKGDLVAPLAGFKFHQTRRRYDGWVEREGDRPPCVGFDHAVLLVAERDRKLRRAIGLLAASVQQGLSTPERLLTASTQIRKLRNGHPLRLSLGDIAGGAQSFAEIDIVRLCQQRGLVVPARQARRQDKNGRWRFLDLEWKLSDGRRCVLEVDGSFHYEVDQWWKDKKRDRAGLIEGDIVLRCSSVELRLEPWAVLDDLVAVGVPREAREAREPLERFVWEHSA